MSTNAAARPAQHFSLTQIDAIAFMEENDKGIWVRAADYDALRKIAEHHREGRLRALEHLAVATARAEAAEAKVAKLSEAIESYLEFPNTGPADDFLRAALNEGGE